MQHLIISHIPLQILFVFGRHVCWVDRRFYYYFLLLLLLMILLLLFFIVVILFIIHIYQTMDQQNNRTTHNISNGADIIRKSNDLHT